MGRVKFVTGFIAVIWIIFLIDFFLPFIHLSGFGIRPRNLFGLIGILTSPFLHGNLAHIISNTVPLFVLMMLLFWFYDKIALNVTLSVILLGGLLVWLLGRGNSGGRLVVHIGASGLIYGLAGFLCVFGFFKKDITSIIISVVVFFLYGGLVWGVLPVRGYISWEGHLFGAVAGIITAYLHRDAEYTGRKKKSE